MDFFNSAVDVLQTLVIALGAGLGIWVEFTFELGWKALKEYMLDAGMQNTLQFPKQVLREAYAAELIDDEGVWLDMLNARNQTSHIYDDHTAAVIAAKIQNAYLPELQKLAARWEK